MSAVVKEIGLVEQTLRNGAKAFEVGALNGRYRVMTDGQAPPAGGRNLLARDCTPSGPYQVWSADITYRGTDVGWRYSAIVLDLFNRRGRGLVAAAAHDDRPGHRSADQGLVRLA